MAQNGDNGGLEEAITRFYERFSMRRVALAAFLVGFFSLGLALLVYVLTSAAFYSVVAFAVSGLVTLNLAIIFIVPPADQLKQARERICAAVRDPSRIRSFSKKAVTLLDRQGQEHALAGADLSVWHDLVVPYLVREGGAPGGGKHRPAASPNASELRAIEARQREVREMEARIQSEQKILEEQRRAMQARSSQLAEAERQAKEAEAKASEEASAAEKTRLGEREKEIAALQEQIEAERRELEERADYVAGVEDSLVERLNQLSEREASLEQGEINAGVRRED